MITVTDNSVQQINAALLSIKSDLEQAKTDVSNNLDETKTEINNSLASANDSSDDVDLSTAIEEGISEVLSGGTFDVNISGNAATATVADTALSVEGNSGGSWVKARDFAVAKNTGDSGTVGGVYRPTISIKTKNGEWSIGSLSGTDDLYFSYTTDANYESNTNTANSFILDTKGNLLGTYFNNSSMLPIRRTRQVFHHNAGVYSGVWQINIPNGSLTIADWSAVSATHSGVVMKYIGTITNVNQTGYLPQFHCEFTGDEANASFDIYFTIDYIVT